MGFNHNSQRNYLPSQTPYYLKVIFKGYIIGLKKRPSQAHTLISRVRWGDFRNAMEMLIWGLDCKLQLGHSSRCVHSLAHRAACTEDSYQCGSGPNCRITESNMSSSFVIFFFFFAGEEGESEGLDCMVLSMNFVTTCITRSKGWTWCNRNSRWNISQELETKFIFSENCIRWHRTVTH